MGREAHKRLKSEKKEKGKKAKRGARRGAGRMRGGEKWGREGGRPMTGDGFMARLVRKTYNFGDKS